MAWQPQWQQAHPSNFEANTLQHRQYQFQHAHHGTLVITRLAKPGNSTQVVFNLQLTPPNGHAIQTSCHAGVDNRDPAANMPLPSGHRFPGHVTVTGTSTIGYGDINISAMGSRGIIYLVHHVMAIAGRELGVSSFIVTSIVNDALDHICEQCGMRWAAQQSAWQGACRTVEDRARAAARTKGWI